jgi:DNA polymerase
MRTQDDRDLSTVRREASACTDCDLYRDATQTVFGTGPTAARLLLVGEQPGDVEDREGEVFVGPAGRLLDRALVDADIHREEIYLTNAVKHFKWQPRGKRRIHKKPDRAEVVACRHWLLDEISIVRPELIVAMGATATSALIGGEARVLRDRGRIFEVDGVGRVMPTVHPSSVLRTDSVARGSAFAAFVADLRVAAAQLHDAEHQQTG